MRAWLIAIAACSARPAPVQAPPEPAPIVLKADLVDASTAMPGSAAEESRVSEPRRIAASTTGVVEGTVRGSRTHELLPGATIVVTSPALDQSQTAITDNHGRYRIDGLPDGTCIVTAYFGSDTVVQRDVVVRAGYATTVDFSIAN